MNNLTDLLFHVDFVSSIIKMFFFNIWLSFLFSPGAVEPQLSDITGAFNSCRNHSSLSIFHLYCVGDAVWEKLLFSFSTEAFLNHAVELHVHWFVQCYKNEPMAQRRC